MLKILHTGDLHLGREYKKQERENKIIAERYKKSRLEAFRKIVHLANEESCDYFVIAGDLYDKKNLTISLHREVCEILSEYQAGTVIILPGNHDYYEGEEDRLWNPFLKLAGENIIFIEENRRFETEDVVFYPCICKDKYSEENALSWLKKERERSENKVNIGIAHGAIEGLSFDREKKYYYMTKKELEDCKLDLWLIGHTHIPYPKEEEIFNQKILNAGTHQQTDIADSAEGSVFLIQIDEKKEIRAKKICTAVIRFLKKEIVLRHGESLEGKIEEEIQNLDRKNTTLRLKISGIALEDEYERKEEIYVKYQESFLKFEVWDEELKKEITERMIEKETIAGSIENQLLKRYLGEPELLNLAFSFVQRCKEGEKDENREIF